MMPTFLCVQEIGLLGSFSQWISFLFVGDERGIKNTYLKIAGQFTKLL